MISASRGQPTSYLALALCCVCLIGMAISGTVIISLISVYLPTKGDGIVRTCSTSFAPFFTAPAGAGSGYIDDADFNKDGKRDLVVANYDDGTISFIAGNGDGTFQAPSDLSTGIGSAPNALVLGDLNKDNNIDIVVVNSGVGNVGVILGKGDGTFVAQTTYSTGTGSLPLGLDVGDLNNDGNIDVVATDNANHVALIFLGSSTGALTLTQTLSTGANSGPYGAVVEDFNGDGRQDIAVSNDRANNFVVFLNQGSTTFSAPTAYTTDAKPYTLVGVDVNKDGKMDLVSGNYNGNSIGIFLGNGDGTFQGQKSFSTGDGSLPYSLYFGDFNRDGRVDIAVVNYNKNNVGVFIGNGNGNFRRQRTYSTGSGSAPIDITVADFNNDGRDDIITANAKASSVSVLLNNCK